MNKTLFNTQKQTPGRIIPPVDAVNNAGGAAYDMGPQHSLVQFAVTGCLANTYYTTAESQLDKVLQFAKQVQPEFLAKTAVYAREKGWMKDMPALLMAILSSTGRGDLVDRAFPRVVDSPKMIQNFMQIVRSGQVGRKTLTNPARRAIRNWLHTIRGKQLLNATVGGTFPFRDILRAIHAKPRTAAERAYWGWATGVAPGGLPARKTAKGVELPACETWNLSDLPQEVAAFEAWKKEPNDNIPDCDFRLLTSQALTPQAWKTLAERCSWQTLRQGLNMFAKHDVFKDPGMLKKVADRLRDEKEIRRAKVFPYQLLAAARYVDATIPQSILAALEDAMEIATENVPDYPGVIAVCPDVSGSMSSVITGNRGSASSKMRCIDIAALVAACVMRKNPDALVLPFEGKVVEFQRKGVPHRLNPRDTVMTNATILAGIGGGSTNCAAPLEYLIERKGIAPDLTIFISDNESWCRPHYYGAQGGVTDTMKFFRKIQAKNDKARMVLIDIQAGSTSQAKNEDKAILNVGGFNDQVFTVAKAFLDDHLSSSALVKLVEAIDL